MILAFFKPRRQLVFALHKHTYKREKQNKSPRKQEIKNPVNRRAWTRSNSASWIVAQPVSFARSRVYRRWKSSKKQSTTHPWLLDIRRLNQHFEAGPTSWGVFFFATQHQRFCFCNRIRWLQWDIHVFGKLLLTHCPHHIVNPTPGAYIFILKIRFARK